MSNENDEFSFRLRLHRENASGRPWFVVPLSFRGRASLLMVPNTVATRSLITPAALRKLRDAGAPGADLIDFRTGRQEYVLREILLADELLPDFAVQVRDVEALRGADGQYVIDGYLGVDVLFGLFSFIAVDTQRLRVTVQLRKS